MQRRFRLQSVLSYREDVEEALQLELARLRIEEQAAQDQLDALNRDALAGLESIRPFQVGRSADVTLIEQGFAYVAYMAERIRLQSAVMAEIATRVEAKRQELVEAMQKRKTMEKLKERHVQAYESWASRVEQSAIDDMVAARYSRGVAAGERS